MEDRFVEYLTIDILVLFFKDPTITRLLSMTYMEFGTMILSFCLSVCLSIYLSISIFPLVYLQFSQLTCILLNDTTQTNVMYYGLTFFNLKIIPTGI